MGGSLTRAHRRETCGMDAGSMPALPPSAFSSKAERMALNHDVWGRNPQGAPIYQWDGFIPHMLVSMQPC